MKAEPKLAYQADPIRDSLKLLGKKWTLLIIRDIAFLKLSRFGEILRNNPELTPRLLSRRLDQLTKAGLLEKESEGYSLTDKGEDAVYILLAILRYGMKHHYEQNIEAEDIAKKLRYNLPEDREKWLY